LFGYFWNSPCLQSCSLSYSPVALKSFVSLCLSRLWI
jgi:hypothetical protein